MSYYFNMGFKDVKKEELLGLIDETVKEFRENAKEIIKENLIYAPSQMHGNIRDREDYSTSWKDADRYWLHVLFKIRFVYWEEYDLIGVQGCLPENLKDKLTNILFQNGADQDYSYDTWDGISYFEKVRDEIKNVDKKYFIQDHMEEDEEDEEEYQRKSSIYEKIFDTLELEEWLYGKEGTFKEYAVEVIANQRQMQDAYITLQSLLWNKHGKSRAFDY